jgi:hypothetical protein
MNQEIVHSPNTSSAQHAVVTHKPYPLRAQLRNPSTAHTYDLQRTLAFVLVSEGKGVTMRAGFCGELPRRFTPSRFPLVSPAL